VIPGAWLAFASAFFAIFSYVLIIIGRRMGVVGCHFVQARIAAGLARDGFALCAVVAWLWHLIR
jgi:hypothetical protein